jgi:PmbA protein
LAVQIPEVLHPKDLKDMNNAESKQLARWASEYAHKQGASETSVTITRRRQVEIEVREQKTESIKESTENNLSLQIYRDNKFSSHNTNNLKRDQLEKFISEAVAVTAYLSADPHRQLPDPSLYPSNIEMNLMLFDNTQQRVTPEYRIEQAMKIEQGVRDQQRELLSVTAYFQDNLVESVKIHSNGFEGEQTETLFSTGGTMSVQDTDSRPSGWYFASSRFLNKLPSLTDITRGIVFETQRQLGQKQAPSGKYTMLVENKVAANLLWYFFDAMNGRNLQQQSSFLLGKQNSQVGSDIFTIIDDPMIETGLGSRTFDFEGIASRKRTMIDKGILKEYFINNYYGRKMGLTPNGGSTSNIIVPPGSRNPEQIIASQHKAILVTGFNGGNANVTTGDYSFGIQGQLIENGRIVRPVNEMNITGNYTALMNNLVEIGNDPYLYSSFRTPLMAFEGVDFSGM